LIIANRFNYVYQQYSAACGQLVSAVVRLNE